MLRRGEDLVTGRPAMEHVSTSYSERLNLTVRMQDRRFTRLTNAFSKKIDNHTASTIIHVMWYNFVRRHATLRVSPRWKPESPIICGAWERSWICWRSTKPRKQPPRSSGD